MSKSGQALHVKHKKRPPCRQKAAWLVLLALFVQMLAPFGHALALDVDSDFNYQIICTATGVKQIPVNADGQPLEPRDATSSCPICYFHGTPALLVPESVPALTVGSMEVAIDFALPVLYSPAGAFRTAPNPPRAPPFII